MKDMAFTNLSFQGIMALNEFWKLLDGVFVLWLEAILLFLVFAKSPFQSPLYVVVFLKKLLLAFLEKIISPFAWLV